MADSLIRKIYHCESLREDFHRRVYHQLCPHTIRIQLAHVLTKTEGQKRNNPFFFFLSSLAEGVKELMDP